MAGLAVIVILILVAAAAFAVALAVSSKRKATSDAELVPGRPSNAPAHWAGSHTPEAKLHHRLVAALRALQASPRRSDGAFAGLVAELEQQAVAIDERLAVIDALPASVKADELASAEAAVAAVEDAVGKLALQMADAVTVEDVAARIDFVAQARAELEGLEGRRAENLSSLQERMEADFEAQQRDTGEAGAP